jgi:hypothetical protein
MPRYIYTEPKDLYPLPPDRIFKQLEQHLLPDIVKIIKKYIACKTCHERIGYWFNQYYSSCCEKDNQIEDVYICSGPCILHGSIAEAEVKKKRKNITFIRTSWLGECSICGDCCGECIDMLPSTKFPQPPDEFFEKKYFESSCEINKNEKTVEDIIRDINSFLNQDKRILELDIPDSYDRRELHQYIDKNHKQKLTHHSETKNGKRILILEKIVKYATIKFI